MYDEVFKDKVVYASTPEEFKEKIDFYLKNNDARNEMIKIGYEHVINNHTYFHRAYQFFNELNMPEEANKCMVIYSNIRKDYNI